MTANTTKQSLYNFCRDYVDNRIDRIQKNISDIHDSLYSETKSSAGDKHETGRAMLQLEREKLGQQLSDAEKMKQVLSKVSTAVLSENVVIGSWVRTSKANFYLAISAGQFTQGDVKVFCISAGTPMGQLLLGKSVGDSIFFNGAEIEILNVT